jgi:putative chitinase
MITLEQLKAVMPKAKPGRCAFYFLSLKTAMAEFLINTPSREAAFLAQITHESGSLRYVRELASGENYEGRADLGNTELGDGVRFRGRGLIQITGRANYLACSKVLFGDDRLVNFPGLLELPEAACRSAAWFWWGHGLNSLADAGEFEKITRRINGGTNGAADRLAHYHRAKGVLSC